MYFKRWKHKAPKWMRQQLHYHVKNPKRYALREAKSEE